MNTPLESGFDDPQIPPVSVELAIQIHRFVMEYIRDVLPDIKPSQRVELFDEVEAGYCRHCGAETASGTLGVCHCTNDE